LSAVRAELVVVGIARDSRSSARALHEPVTALVYLPIDRYPSTTLSVVLRGRGPAAGLEPVARSAVATVDPGVPLRFQLIIENVRNSIAEQRLLARMLSLFSALAVLLSGIGLYGILAFMVGERTREFGIRMALGARALGVAVIVMRHGARVVGPGLLLGMFGALWLARIIRSALVGVNQLQPSVLVAALALLAAVATVATLIPSHAATRVEPAVALRKE
jgi:putative ABC transport system permease protein